MFLCMLIISKFIDREPPNILTINVISASIFISSPPNQHAQSRLIRDKLKLLKKKYKLSMPPFHVSLTRSIWVQVCLDGSQKKENGLSAKRWPWLVFYNVPRVLTRLGSCHGFPRGNSSSV